MAMRRALPDDVLVCADVLGAFGVTAADVRARGRTSDDLETALAEALGDSRDRTAFLRQTICRSDRGVDVSARYSVRALERELSDAFAAIGWSLSVTDRGRRLRLEARGPAGRCREVVADYPETPLGTDNFPAIVHAIDETLLAGVDARFVLCSSGRDRWRAALVEVDELERVRERYHERIEAFDRPLLPEHDAAAYVPSARPDGDAVEPWPEWALEEADGTTDRPSSGGGASAFIEEAEPAVEDGASAFIEEAESATDRTTSAPSSGEPVASRDGFELGGWSPTVTRVRDDGDRDADSRSRAEPNEPAARATGRSGSTTAGGVGRSSSNSAESTRDPSASDDGFGELSGSVTTTRVSNDSFGAGVEPESESDRYLALGAALGTGTDVSVRGLLEDEAFLPELPAVEPDETRIEFTDEFDPNAVSDARATAEQNGFVWVGAGELETVRIEDGEHG
nr:hypothetical protein [Natronobeatus ordinarius]